MTPDRDCSLCPRLAAFRDRQRTAFPEWHNAPVASFGPTDAPLLVVGLAPGLRGANRTGRPFTGDFAGLLLYETLLASGLGRGAYGGEANDGVVLKRCRITNAVRCLPPANKPTTDEIAACRRFLQAEIESMRQLRVILALGRIAHDSVVRAAGMRLAELPFRHGALHRIRPGLMLADSYHCSRYNTNTGRLTEAMFRDVLARIVPLLSD